MGIALVGGGHAASILLDYFSSMDGATIVGLADLQADAPGVLRARELGVHTTEDMISLINHRDTDVIVELTGVPKVRQIILETMRENQHIITAGGAKLVCDMISSQEEINAKAADRISTQFEALGERLQGAIDQTDSSHGLIGKVLRELQMIAMNGQIEAASAGTVGDGFGIVVSRMSEMLGQINEALGAIASSADESRHSLRDLESAEKELHTVFR